MNYDENKIILNFHFYTVSPPQQLPKKARERNFSFRNTKAYRYYEERHKFLCLLPHAFLHRLRISIIFSVGGKRGLEALKKKGIDTLIKIYRATDM